MKQMTVKVLLILWDRELFWG